MARPLTGPSRSHLQESEQLLRNSHAAMLLTTRLSTTECPEELIFDDDSTDLNLSRVGSAMIGGQTSACTIFTPPQVPLRAATPDVSRVKATGASRRLGSISQIAQTLKDLEDLQLSPPISPFKQPSRLSSSGLSEPDPRPMYSAEQRDVSRTESTLINQSARELVRPVDSARPRQSSSRSD